MGDLMAFLRARLDEDEHMCKFAMWDGEGPWTEVSSGVLQTAGDLYPTGNQGISRYAVHFQPERMLREVEMKRLVIRFVADADHVTTEDGYNLAPMDVLRLLAQPYATHPEYRAEWGA